MIITSKDTANVAGQTGQKRKVYVHGLLLPVDAHFYKNKDKDANKVAIEGTGGEVDYPTWLALASNKRTQRWQVAVDQKMFRPDFETPTTRGVALNGDGQPFPASKAFVIGVLDTVGLGAKSIPEFLDRANSQTWYIETLLENTGEVYNEKDQTIHKPIRMTQDEATIREWHKERYPQGEIEIPADKLDMLKKMYKLTKAATNGPDKFNTLVTQDEELNPYLVQAAANDYALVKG